MPNVKSAIKRARTASRKRESNKAKRSEMRTAIRKCREAMLANAENKKELLIAAIKKVDMAASKKLIHKNTASRRKSQLLKAYNASQVSE